LISGATGLLGTRLTRALLTDGIQVRALSRDPDRARRKLGSAVEVAGWNGLRVGPGVLKGVTDIVHLAGEPIFAGLLTPARRRRIASSRIEATRSLASAMGSLAAGQRPPTLVCASAVGYYGSRGEEVLTEESAPGSGFLADVCRDWESAALAIEGVRVVCLRIGIVLAREGGALPMMALPFRFGLGGQLGDGNQWVSWIHIDDLVGLVRAALRDADCAGPMNATSPEPVRNRDLTAALADVVGHRARLPVPAFALRLALGELALELLGSRHVVPKRALDRGYAFTHGALRDALRTELRGQASGNQ